MVLVSTTEVPLSERPSSKPILAVPTKWSPLDCWARMLDAEAPPSMEKPAVEFFMSSIKLWKKLVVAALSAAVCR